MNRLALAMTELAIMTIVMAGCEGGSPTNPVSCEPVTIHSGQQFYTEVDRPEQEFTGILTKNCIGPSPGGRDFCYWLNNGMPIYHGIDQKKLKLDEFVGKSVVIQGKLVNLDAGPPEIWPATIRCAG